MKKEGGLVKGVGGREGEGPDLPSLPKSTVLDVKMAVAINHSPPLQRGGDIFLVEKQFICDSECLCSSNIRSLEYL